MAMVLLTTVLPQETHTGDGDSRWNLVKVYQAVDIVWAVWIFNSVSIIECFAVGVLILTL